LIPDSPLHASSEIDRCLQCLLRVVFRFRYLPEKEIKADSGPWQARILPRRLNRQSILAGTHLHNTSGTESNLDLARATLREMKASVIAFSSFEEGLMVGPGNPHGIRTLYVTRPGFPVGGTHS
jgi:hypothetical protein